MMNSFLQRQFDSARQWLRSQPRLLSWVQRTLLEVEKFVIAGPTLIGFLPGLLRYQPGSVHFETGFQSLVFFVGYLAALIVLQIFDSLFFSNWPMVLALARSLLAIAYLAVTLRQVIEWRAGSPKILPAVRRVREWLRPVIGDAA
jgi:hypothetical protein